jgi:UDP-N-acetylmuramate dehydrogenase
VTDIYGAIEKINGVAVRKDELLSLHTTLGVGGPCDLMVWVSEISALIRLMEVIKAESLPFTVLGGGSNVLVRDGGIEGAVLRLVDDFACLEAGGDVIDAGAGAHLPEVVSRATAAGIGGFEFLSGIPGTLGGAIKGNAGSAEEWISQRLKEVRVLNDTVRLAALDGTALDFGYRRSEISPGWIVTGAVLQGFSTDVESIRHMVEEKLEARRVSQPVSERTAGCIFKNPPGGSAGKIIEEAGLKGRNVGGASVSTVHANYLVNAGGATAREMLELIQIVKTRVKDSYGIDLELEIKVIGKN